MNTEVEQYLPENSIELVKKLLSDYKEVQIKIVNQRKTKHGDYRRLNNRQFLITINKSLNPNQFLLTLIHEIAHHITFQKHGKVKPHGKEWKLMFKNLMLPFLHPTIFPDTVLPHLASYLKNPKASTDSDVNLSLALRNNIPTSGKSFIFELSLGSRFWFRDRLYSKGEKRRTRFECVELNSKKRYLFNQNAEVIVYEK